MTLPPSPRTKVMPIYRGPELLKLTMSYRAKFDDSRGGPPPSRLTLLLSPTTSSCCAAVHGACAQKPACRRRHLKLPAVAGVFLLISLGASVRSSPLDESLPKIVRKNWGKPSRKFVHDGYVTVARPLLGKLAKKAQRIANRLWYPDYHTLGCAWFNAFLVDMSEYILRRSTCAGLDEEPFEGEPPVQPQEVRSHSGTHWSAPSSRLVDTGYQAAEELAARLSPAKESASRAPAAAAPADEYSFNEEDSSASGQVIKLNMPTIMRWKESFENIFMGVAKRILPRNVLELVKSMDENQYIELRPTLEHALYRTLTEFYPTLMSTEISEAILPNFHVAVSCETCPFSLYTSYTFMALIAAGRSGVDGLFLADEMLQHYKSDEPYTSPECKAFNEDMAEALIMDSMTLYELVGRTAGAARSSFYALPSLVRLQSATLLGTHTRLEGVDKRNYDASAEGAKDKVALREMVDAFAPEHKRDNPEKGRHAVSPRYILEMSERMKATSLDLSATTTKPGEVGGSHETEIPDPLASLVLKQKSVVLGVTRKRRVV